MHRGTYWYLLRVTTLDCWKPCEPGHWMVLSRFIFQAWDGPTGAQLYSHSGPLFIYWSLSSLFY
ncbi:hypothetical protein T08_4782 [Trichinella sp. T8]|nr:hypothetical protein T08_4782 [Trichinella sp. T8]